MGAVTDCCDIKLNKYEDRTENIQSMRASQLAQKIKVNPRFIRLTKVLQSFCKGMITRKKFGKNKTNNLIQNIEKKQTNFTLIKITKDDYLQELNIKFKPLQENVILVARKCIEYEDKSQYYGEWNENLNQKHGRGILIHKNRFRYDGYFRNDKANIFGILKFANGENYEGEFLNGKYNGYGTYIKLNGEKYSGNFKLNQKEGHGNEFYVDGSFYSGDFKDSMRNGIGKIIFVNKDEFEGEFRNNSINGKGTYTWFSDKTKFICDWKDNKMVGDGQFFWPSGKKFEGNLRDNSLNGTGLFEWDFGVKYKYKWENGEALHEEGEFYNPSTKEWNQKELVNQRHIIDENENTSIPKVIRYSVDGTVIPKFKTQSTLQRLLHNVSQTSSLSVTKTDTQKSLIKIIPKKSQFYK